MYYSLITDASFCPETKIATGAAVYYDEHGTMSKPKSWTLEAKDSTEAELLAVAKGIQLLPKSANVTIFTDCKFITDAFDTWKEGKSLKQKTAARFKVVRTILKKRDNTNMLWAGTFGGDHNMLHVVHNAAYSRMKSLRGSYAKVSR